MHLTREERMRSRMRGAARHQVQDADFGDLFTIPAPVLDPEHAEPQATDSLSSQPAAPSPASPPAQHVISNTSSKSGKLDDGGTAAPTPLTYTPSTPIPHAQSSSRNRRSRRIWPTSANGDPNDLEKAPVESLENEEYPQSTTSDHGSTSHVQGSRLKASASAAQDPSLQSSSLSDFQMAEEVEESPPEQPGSGQRRRVRARQAITSSALISSARRADESNSIVAFIPSSSPLSRKSRRGVAAMMPAVRPSLRRSTRLSGSSNDTLNYSSGNMSPVKKTSAIRVPEQDDTADSTIPEIEGSILDRTAEDKATEDQAAQPVDDAELVRHAGSKRHMRSIVAGSPELASEDITEASSTKRLRKEPPPKRKKLTHTRPRQATALRVNSGRPRPAQAPARKRKNGKATGPPVPVRIQRFVKPRRLDENDVDADDILSTDIPFANRRGVNAVDVLAQMCEDLIDTSLQSLKETFDSTQDAAAKKDSRVKSRALQAFKEELRTRFLEHTIALDTLFALKKRVRAAQKQKLKLRDRIIQIRAERQQLALRMDAVRIKYGEDSKEALHSINLSSTMHDIDLAIEQGQAAPELSVKDQKTADLANLELLISRVTEHVCSKGPGGGALNKIRAFNAFLERAIAAL